LQKKKKNTKYDNELGKSSSANEKKEPGIKITVELYLTRLGKSVMMALDLGRKLWMEICEFIIIV
jgi:hypothetical protein